MHSNDGHVEIQISDDGLYAYADLYPAIGEGKALNAAYVRTVLEVSVVEFGIDDEAIEDYVQQCNESRHSIHRAVIARGNEPVKKVPAYLKLKKKFFQAISDDIKQKIVTDSGEQVDHRARSPFIPVMKDEAIVRQVAMYPGIVGRKVTGEDIPPEEHEIIVFQPGENLVLKGDRYYAACDGCFELKGNTVQVSKNLAISGDVDYSTGHIKFPGDVSISGDVVSGFDLLIGGNLKVGGVLEAGVCKVLGDMYCDGGIIRHDEEPVQCRGSLKAKFMENAVAEIRKDIFVKDSVLSCSLYTLGKMRSGKEGKILSSEIHAVAGIEIHKVGNPVGSKTRLYTGADFRASRQLAELHKQHSELTAELKSGKGNPVEIQEILLEIEARMETRIEIVPGSDIRISGTICPGVYVQVCNAIFIVDKEMQKVRFFYDVENARVLYESL